jgi:hypothetical protein
MESIQQKNRPYRYGFHKCDCRVRGVEDGQSPMELSDGLLMMSWTYHEGFGTKKHFRQRLEMLQDSGTTTKQSFNSYRVLSNVVCRRWTCTGCQSNALISEQCSPA